MTTAVQDSCVLHKRAELQLSFDPPFSHPIIKGEALSKLKESANDKGPKKRIYQLGSRACCHHLTSFLPTTTTTTTILVDSTRISLSHAHLSVYTLGRFRIRLLTGFCSRVSL